MAAIKADKDNERRVDFSEELSEELSLDDGLLLLGNFECNWNLMALDTSGSSYKTILKQTILIFLKATLSVQICKLAIKMTTILFPTQ